MRRNFYKINTKVKLMPFAMIISFFNVWTTYALIYNNIDGSLTSTYRFIMAISVTILVYALLSKKCVDLVRNNRINKNADKRVEEDEIVIESVFIIAFFTSVILMVSMYLVTTYLGRSVLLLPL